MAALAWQVWIRTDETAGSPCGAGSRCAHYRDKSWPPFDAPILYCVYLDSRCGDHVLLQAIARVNRPYEDEQQT